MPNLKEEIKGMKDQGLDNSKIIDELKNKGHSAQDIYASLEQGGTPTGANLEPPSPSQEMGAPSSTEMPDSQPMKTPESPEQPPAEEFPMPAPTGPPPQIPQRQEVEQIEEISEAIVEEKIQEFSSSIGDINVWKEQITSEINAIKQEIIRNRNQLENLQTATIGKVEVYNKSVTSMSAEMKALSKVMEKIMQPLTMNVKELTRITEKFKKVK
jgi:DNA-binding transcriptional MerR regulator